MKSTRPATLRRCCLAALLLVVAAVLIYAIPRRHVGLAVLASWQDRWADVRRHAEAHLNCEPASHRAHLLLARSFLHSGDLAAAQRIFDQAEELGTVSAADRLRLAERYVSAGQPRLAAGTFQQVLAGVPDNPDALLGLSALFQQGGQTQRGKELAERATQIAPHRDDAWILLAKAHLALAQADQAAEYLQKAVALEGAHNVEARKMLADVLLLHLNDPLKAQQQLEAARTKAPSDPQILWMLAESYINRQPPEFGQAEQHLRNALQLDAENRRALLLLAGLSTARGDGPFAIALLGRVLGRNPRDRQAIHLMKVAKQLAEAPATSALPPVEITRRQLPVVWHLRDVAQEAGLDFRHISGENKLMRYYPETLGSGVAVLDYDGDGWMDLYFVTSNFLAPGDPRKDANPHNVLYRNTGDGRFQDTTAASGLGDTGFGHGAAVGDFDNDGLADLYVSNYGPNALYRNAGDGTFADVTVAAGVGDAGMSTSAAWFDYDEDGDLDLYVCNYAVYDVEHPYDCTQPGIGRIYCGPDRMQSQRDTLYRNKGDGTFTDVTTAMGIGRDESPQHLGKGLGVVAADLNSDGHVDLAVANDLTPNFLFAGDGRGFSDASASAGTAANSQGQWESCMGIDAGDVDGDGDFDLLVTNQWMESNTLFRNEGGLVFLDVSDFSGMAFATKSAVGWGTALVDLDNDGDLDHFVTNGHFFDWRGDAQPFRQRAMLWSNTGNGHFDEVSSAAGPYFHTLQVGRGAAFGDLDNDGDTDIVLNHWNDVCSLLRNDTQSGGAWFRCTLIGVHSNRDAVGTALQIEAAGLSLHLQRKGGGSYLSYNDPRILVGLGRCAQIDRLTVRWPGGKTQQFTNLGVNRSYRLIEGGELLQID